MPEGSIETIYYPVPGAPEGLSLREQHRYADHRSRGISDACNGRGRDENPNSPGTSEHDWWLAGYNTINPLEE